ncbi:hypothetical protein GDO86_017285 [Hymenochirus boettgeri]|uniref:ABC transmembrane type-1 domain-containing protein n=1 Tax=Hymenochirus boettgeri TaxID=247094 RepID=A0A8T2IJL5_9PIPI|nr:hypothetical protein GDO86_017285 [Hymenochirus boettgeri]
MKWICRLNETEKFWDINQTWHTDNPDFSQCFHNSILNWIPSFYLFVCSPFYVFYLWRHGQGYIRMSALSKAKTCFGALLVLTCYTELFYTVWNITHNIHQSPVFLISPLILGSSMLLATCLIQYERMQGVRSSAILLFFWLLALLCATFQLRTKITIIISKAPEIDRLRYTLFIVYFVLVLIQSVLSTFTEEPPFFSSLKKEMNPCPVSEASFLSRVTFSWFTEIMFKGYRQPLKEDDVWALRKSDRAEEILDSFSEEIQKELKKAKLLEEPTMFTASPIDNIWISPLEKSESKLLLDNKHVYLNQKTLLKVIMRFFGLQFLLSTLLMFLYTAILFINPLLVRLLLRLLKETSSPSWQGFLVAVLLFICPCGQSLFLQQHDYMCYLIGLQLRAAIVGTVYKKALIISSAGRKESSAGEIVNLISTDVQKLMDLAACLNYMWSAPLTVIVAMYLLWQTMGIAVLAGVAVFILNLPFMTVLGLIIKKVQEQQMNQKDNRIKLISDILQGIKVLKLYAWENAFMKKVDVFRLVELKAIKTGALLFSGAAALFISSPFLKNVLDAEKAFVTIILLNILRIPLRMFPLAISLLVQSSVSLKRFVKFFSAEELDPESVYTDVSLTTCYNKRHGTFTWSSSEPPCLHSWLTVAIVGKGSVAYIPQENWIPNATFKENILFGRKMEELV